MTKWLIGVVIFAVASLGVYLYTFGGLKDYLRAMTVINKMMPEPRHKAKDEFGGTDPRGAVRGILAGNWIGKVWVWTSRGIKSYQIDDLSVYSIFDGCNPEVKSKLNKGEKNVIQRELYTDFGMWKEKVKAGDYVVVYPAKKENGGTMGNLREVYGYNFWLFLNTGIDIECAK